jgi:large subunit ribosomal protein L35
MKQKTKKSVAKKFKITGSGKVMKRATGNNHYNVRDTGSANRAKRRDGGLFATDQKNVLKALPHA